MMDIHSNDAPRSVFGTWRKNDFSSWRQFYHSPALAWVLFVIGCLLITLLLSFQTETLPTHVRVGFVASKDIKADQNYEIIDERSTQKNREDALRSVLPIYDYDETLSNEVDRQIQESFSKTRNWLNEHPQASAEELKGVFEKNSRISLDDEDAKLLYTMRYRSEAELLIRSLIQRSMAGLISEDGNVLHKNDEKGIILRRIRIVSGDNEVLERNLSSIKSLDESRAELSDRLKKNPPNNLNQTKNLNYLGLSSIASKLLRSNVTYNLSETESRKTRAVANVKPVIIKMQSGESIIRSGSRFEPWHLVVLQGIQKQKKETSFAIKFVGTFLFVTLLLLVTYTFAARFIRKFKPTKMDAVFMLANLIAILVFVRLFAAGATAFRDSFPFQIEMQALYYAIPVAAGAMLTRLVLNAESAIVFGVIASVLSGLFLKTDLDLSIYFLISSIAAAGSIAYADKRSAILRAGVYTGLVNALTIFAIKMIDVVSVTESWSSLDISSNLILGFLGGMNSALFVLFYTPIVEMVFGYTTDIKLLELGNLNHPLMREMIVKAPGTYHHSQLVAVLAEAASHSVSANPILARVGAYFHDVGKMKKPLYFIENQQGGENRHDHLNPAMSALIISSHVRDGVELAQEHSLPKIIVDMIPQHQGTKLITFFYNKAKEQEVPGQEVKEEDYRYPGPRPQTREAGILLLADGVEAAVRSLPEKNPTKIQAMVQKIINKSFAEEQLEECDLTLRDLRIIADSFARVLIGIYHQRIEYPETHEKEKLIAPIKKLEVVKTPPPNAANSG